MAEERTQTPSQKRREEARQRGLVARSPALSAAAGLLAAVVLLGVWGDDLFVSLLGLVRESLSDVPSSAADLSEIVLRLRSLAARLALPCGVILWGGMAVTLAVHQLQVGGLWLPGLLAPDPARLWSFGGGSEIS